MIRDIAWLWQHDKAGCAAFLLPCLSLLVLALHGFGVVDLSTLEMLP